jgi:hypothetical protein
MSYDEWKTTDPRDREPDYEGHDITKDCDVRGLEHRWDDPNDKGLVICVDCGAVCDTNNDKEAE